MFSLQTFSIFVVRNFSYMFTLHPKIDHKPFSPEEDCILMAAVKEHGTNFRDFPSDLLPGRNTRQIRCRYNNVLRHVGKREHWNEENDTNLMGLVAELGTSNWLEIANRIVHHSRTSCRQRYMTIQRYLTKHPNSTIADVPRRKKAFSTNVTTDNWMETMLNNQADDNTNAIENHEVLALEPARKKAKPSNKRKPTIIMKANERAFYEYFKYAFNFEYGRRIYASDGLIENIQIAADLLHAPVIPIQLNVYDGNFSDYVTLHEGAHKVQLEHELRMQLNELRQGDFRFPINMNTLLGLRGLTIAFEMDKQNGRKVKKIKKIKKEPHEDQSEQPKHAALTLFEQRFRSMFANTAIVAKLTDLFAPRIENVKLRNRKRAQAAPTSTVTSKAFIQSADQSVQASTSCNTVVASTSQQIDQVGEFGGLPIEQTNDETSYSTYEPQATASGLTTNFDQYSVEPFENMYVYEIHPIDDNDGPDDGSGEPKYAFQVVVCDPTQANETNETVTTVAKLEK